MALRINRSVSDANVDGVKLIILLHQCPYYNQTTYTDTNGNIYQVYCGYDGGGNTLVPGTYRSDGMASCMSQCDTNSGCTSFSYTYTGSEPPEGSANTLGACYLKSGTATTNANPSVAVAVRVGSTTASSPTGSPTSTTSSSNSVSTSACNLAPVPSAPVCPSANGLMFTDGCGTNYTVYCGSDTSPGAATQGTANSISACMLNCDNYSGCKAATFLGNTCYLKTAFTALTTSNNAALVALVRYIPPNPNYAAPPQAPCQNCSSGCGSTLPAGLTPNGASVLFNFVNPSDGLLRNYTIHIPQFYDANHASPVIFAFHGNGDSAANIESQTGMSSSALNPYAIAVYVNGYGHGYESNPGWAPGGTYSYVDDLGFINALIANITQTFCVDTGRLFAVGHSNGGGFVNVLACDPVLSVKIAAFAGNSAACYTNFTTGDPYTIEPVNTPIQPVCSPGRNNVPMLEFHGTADTQIRYEGDTTHNGRILPWLQHWATAWSVREGYGTTNYSTTPSSNVVKYQFGGNSGQLGIVTHYMLIGWVHAWASTSAGAPMDAAPPIMDFFYRWSDPNRAPQYFPSTSSSSSSSTSTLTVSSSSATSTAIVMTTSSSSSSLSSSSSSSSSQSSSSSSSFSSSSSASSQSSSSSLSSSTSSQSSPITVSTTASSQTSPSSTSVSYTRPTLACPSANGQTYTDSFGIQYVVACGADTTRGNYGSYEVTSAGSFDDCFYLCSTNYQSVTNCTSFSYYSATAPNGLGPGNCFLKNLSPISFISSDANHAGAIRVEYYVDQPYTPGYVTTTTITTSSSSTSTLASSSRSSVAQTSSSSSSSSVQSLTTSSVSSPSSSAGQTTSSSSPSSATDSGSSTSQTTSTVQSSSSSASAATAAAPCVNGAQLTDANGNSYTIQCDSDTTQGGYASQAFPSGDFTQCMPACDSNDACAGWSWLPYQLGGGICFFKHAPVSFTAGTSGMVAGILVSSSSSTTSSSSTISTTRVASTASSATLSSSSTVSTPSGIASCPGSNGQTVTDLSGIQYQIGCGNDTTGGNYNTYVADNGLNDCFAFCDNSQALDGTDCTAWTYWGGPDGVGFGQCYLKSSDGEGFTASDNSHVGAIRVTPPTASISSAPAGSGATSSVSGSTSSPSASPAATCQNNTVVTDANGVAYTIYCDADTDSAGGGAFATQAIDRGDFTACETACDAAEGCGAWVWQPLGNGGVCYLKHLPQNYVPGNTGYVVGIVASGLSSSTGGSSPTTSPSAGMTSSPSAGATTGPSITMSMSSTTSAPSPLQSPYGPQCPGANGTTYADESGIQYMILCDTNTDPGAYSSAAEPDVGSCIDACHTQTDQQCIAVTYTGGTCYFKAQYYGTSSNPGTEAAILMSVFGGGSSSSAPATSQSSTTASGATSISETGSLSVTLTTSSSSQMVSFMSSTATSNVPSGQSSSSSVTSSLTSTSDRSSSSLTQSGTSGSSAAPLSSSGSSTQSGTPSSSNAVSSPSVSSLATPTSQSPSMSSSEASQETSETSPSVIDVSTDNPSTKSPETSSAASATTTPFSSTSPLPSCPSQTTQPQPSDNAACSDAYGNPYNVTYGTVYQGTITMRAVRPNFGSCLTLCDTTVNCVAVNYIGSECQLLSRVTGNTTVAGGGGAAATRPADVTTVYTAPPTSTSSMVGATSVPASNAASGATSIGGSSGGPSTFPGPSSVVGPASSAVASTPSVTRTSTPSLPTTTSNRLPPVGSSSVAGPPSSSNAQGSSGANNGGGNGPSTNLGGTSYMSTNAYLPTTQATMASPSYSASLSVSSGGSGGGGGPGPVSGGNSGITNGMTGSMSGSMETGSASYGSMTGTASPNDASGSVPINTNNNVGSVSPTSSSGPPASTGPVCPNYDDQQYTDAQGSTYNIQCNTTYSGSVITSANSTSNIHKRQSGAVSVPSCIDYCDQTPECVAITVDCSGTCTLLGSIDNTVDNGFCGVGAKRLTGPGPMGSPNLITVTVCGAKRTRTTTVVTTATLTTCPANGKCTAGSNEW